MKKLFILLILLIPMATALEITGNSSVVGVNILIPTPRTTISGNLTNFTELTDTPSAYTGDGGNCVKVNAGETGLEFSSCGSITETDPLWTENYTNLNDTWVSTFNITYEAAWQYAINNSFYPYDSNPFGYLNTSTGDSLIGSGVYIYNDSTTLYFNTTLADTNLSVNSSDYWDGLDTYNTTSFEEQDGGILGISFSWLTSFINAFGFRLQSNHTFNGDVDVNGELNVSGNVLANGGLGLLFNPTGSITAFAHRSHANETNFAIAQQANGHTHINAPKGQSIGFHINNGSEVAEIYESYTVYYQNINMSENNITNATYLEAIQDVCISGGNCLSSVGSESDPFWSDNFTLYNGSWSNNSQLSDSQVWDIIDNGTFIKTESDPLAYNGSLQLSNNQSLNGNFSASEDFCVGDNCLSNVGTDISGASFITVSGEAGLSGERRITTGFGITGTDGGAGTTYNLVIDDEDLNTNSSYYWNSSNGSVVGFNTTQFEVQSGSIFGLDLTWIDTFINSFGFLTSVPPIHDQDLNTTDSPTFVNLTLTSFFKPQTYLTSTEEHQFSFTSNADDLTLNVSDVGGANFFEIATSGGFLELWANPNVANGYKLFTITETQGSDTEINFYEGGTGHNRFWDSGSARFGGDEGYLCTELNDWVDCDTSSTGADVVIQDDTFIGGKIYAGNGSLNTSDSGDIDFDGYIQGDGGRLTNLTLGNHITCPVQNYIFSEGTLTGDGHMNIQQADTQNRRGIYSINRSGSFKDIRFTGQPINPADGQFWTFIFQARVNGTRQDFELNVTNRSASGGNYQEYVSYEVGTHTFDAGSVWTMYANETTGTGGFNDAILEVGVVYDEC